MKTPSNLPAASDLAKNVKPPINVVITYADRLTHRIAVKVCSRIFRRIHRVFAVHTFSWSFDSLCQPDALEHAAAAAARADMIFCSVYASQPLPATAKAWTARWLPRTGQTDGALVAWLKTNGEAGSETLVAENDLIAVARAARMDLFVKVFDQPAPESSSFDLPRAARRTARTNRPTAEGQFNASLTPALKPACGFA